MIDVIKNHQIERMFQLKVVNNYYYECLFYYDKDGHQQQAIINKHYQFTYQNLTNGYIAIPGIGQVNFTYLGEEKISNYEKYPIEKYGVLLRVHTSEVYYRFDNLGSLELVIDKYGGCSVKGNNGTLIEIELNELIIKDS